MSYRTPSTVRIDEPGIYRATVITPDIIDSEEIVFTSWGDLPETDPQYRNPVRTLDFTGENFQDKEIIIENAVLAYSVTLTVTHEGVPYQGATVRVVSGPTSPPQQVTDTNGQVIFDNLVEGVYVFEATAPNLAGRISLDPSITATAEIQLTAPTPMPNLFPLATILFGIGIVISGAGERR